MPERLPPRDRSARPAAEQPRAPEPRPAPAAQPMPAQRPGPDAPPRTASQPGVGAPASVAGQFDLFASRKPPPPEPVPVPPQLEPPPELAPPARAQAQRGPRIYSVGELTREVKAILEGRFPLVLVEGELSNLRQPSSGHLYFTLKDEEACIDAVLFKTQARQLRFAPQNGLQLLARGRLSLYEPQGRYQIICDSIEPLGAGALQIAFEQLKEKLSKEGLFHQKNKRPLPFLPRRIALVTSPSGAAVHDFVRVLHRRFPNLPVLIVPARVQGDGAAAEIARGIARAARQPRVDVVVVARGGGSLEDLWAFNEEVVARALAACPVPTVSAVGHEVDFTIADFAADVRAATPTAAAELLARVKEELVLDLSVQRARLLRAWKAQQVQRRAQLDGRSARILDPRRLIGERRLRLDKLEQRLSGAVEEGLTQRLAKLRALKARLDGAHPSEQLHRLRREVAALEQRLSAQVQRLLSRRRRDFEVQAGQLDALSPLRVLARGYAVAFDSRGHALRAEGEAAVGDRLRIQLADGALEAQVTGKLPAW